MTRPPGDQSKGIEWEHTLNPSQRATWRLESQRILRVIGPDLLGLYLTIGTETPWFAISFFFYLFLFLLLIVILFYSIVLI